MPFLSIFRTKDKDGSRSKTPVPLSPAPPSTYSKKSSFSRSRSRPSFASSRSCTSPPPQLATISPHSDFDYVLPEIDAASLVGGPSPTCPVEKELAQVQEESPAKQRRGLPFGRRRGSTSSGLIAAVSPSPSVAVTPIPTPAPRPFSEALDTFMTRKEDEERGRDLDLARDTLEASSPPNPEKK